MIVTITAANGDELWMDYSDGELCVDFSSFPVITFVGDVGLSGTGGTGRFSESAGDYRLFFRCDQLWSDLGSDRLLICDNGINR